MFCFFWQTRKLWLLSRPVVPRVTLEPARMSRKKRKKNKTRKMKRSASKNKQSCKKKKTEKEKTITLFFVKQKKTQKSKKNSKQKKEKEASKGYHDGSKNVFFFERNVTRNRAAIKKTKEKNLNPGP